MARPLRPDDFPLRAMGASVFRRSEGWPVFTALDPAMAQDLVARLNRDQHRQVGGGTCDTPPSLDEVEQIIDALMATFAAGRGSVSKPAKTAGPVGFSGLVYGPWPSDEEFRQQAIAALTHTTPECADE